MKTQIKFILFSLILFFSFENGAVASNAKGKTNYHFDGNLGMNMPITGCEKQTQTATYKCRFAEL